MGVWWAQVSVCSCGGGGSKISSQFAKKVASPSFAIVANPLTKTRGEGGYKYIALGLIYETFKNIYNFHYKIRGVTNILL